MAGFCPDDWHGTTDADLQQMSWGEDYWLYADAAGAGGFQPRQFTVKERADNRKQYAIHDAAIALATAAGLTFHLLPQDRQNALLDAAEAGIAIAKATGK